MTTTEIRRLYSTQSFEPFRILVADGRHYDVRHPERLAVQENGRRISIGMSNHFVTLDLLMVTGIEQPIPRGRNGKGKKSA